MKETAIKRRWRRHLTSLTAPHPLPVRITDFEFTSALVASVRDPESDSRNFHLSRIVGVYGIAGKLIDRFHVDERLARYSRSSSIASRPHVSFANRKYLDRSDTAIDRIVRRIDELLLHVLLGALEYFRNHRHLLRYATSLRHGYPISSGPTEGACKSVVTNPDSHRVCRSERCI